MEEDTLEKTLTVMEPSDSYQENFQRPCQNRWSQTRDTYTQRVYRSVLAPQEVMPLSNVLLQTVLKTWDSRPEIKKSLQLPEKRAGPSINKQWNKQEASTTSPQNKFFCIFKENRHYWEEWVLLPVYKAEVRTGASLHHSKFFLKIKDGEEGKLNAMYILLFS